MKIAYDHQIFAGQAYGGISRYFCEIAERIGAFQYCDVTVYAPFYVNVFVKSTPQAVLRGVRIPDVPRTRRLRERLGAAVVKQTLRHSPPDVVHETYYTDTTVAPKSSRIVVTVHDMINEKLPLLMSPRDMTTQLKVEAVRRADHIICVSETTKRDLIDILGIGSSNISVIYHGWSLRIPEWKQICYDRARNPFVLYVGLRGGYKNFQKFLQAYGDSPSLKHDFKLVCFGGPTFSKGEMDSITKLGLHGRVSWVSGDDCTLRTLYSSATCLVYPSLYEGFGIPVVEAMGYGCPVVCSSAGSLPEVAADAAEYFDPSDSESIRMSIQNVVYSEDRCNTLIARGRRRAMQFSWERCARETFEVYSSLIKGPVLTWQSAVGCERC